MITITKEWRWTRREGYEDWWKGLKLDPYQEVHMGDAFSGPCGSFALLCGHSPFSLAFHFSLVHQPGFLHPSWRPFS